MEQEHKENTEEIFQGRKKMYLFNEIVDGILQCNEVEGSDKVLEIFHVEIELLERWLKEPEGEMKLAEPDTKDIVVTMRDRNEMFLTFIELN